MATKTEVKIEETLGDNLVTLAEYYRGTEKNLLAVCRTIDLETLKGLKQLKEKPLLFTQEELISGVDVFPIDFLNIKEHHRILYGEDFLKDLKISKGNLRHQLEFEFRSKLIHLRREFLQFKGKGLDNLILSAVPALMPIIGGLICLKDLGYDDTQDLFKVVSDGYGINVQVLKEIYEIRQGRSKFKKDKEYYIKELIRVLTEIGKIIDDFKVME
ncbi:MAG: hypothetical protein SVM80_06970 [Halobacteriota archaeon]|nr:hypothetical protein [Halobacteriota archaeon]